MGLFDFVKNAGEKIFGNSEKEDKERAGKLESYVHKLGLSVERLAIKIDDDVATVTGEAASQKDREKVVLAVGNTSGIAKVEDRMTVAPEKEAAKEKVQPATYYTVVSGDTLSAIAKKQYGDAMKYPVIFEANKPMLKDPDKIYPGQVLRIPAQPS